MTARRADDEKLNAVLGVALRALVEAGAEPQFLATFVERYRPEFAKELDVDAPAPPDLHALIVSAVREVVGPALSPGRERKTLSINVLVHGQRTSVSVRRDRLRMVEAAVGGAEQARKVVREVAATAPRDLRMGERSVWLDDALDGFLRLRQSSTATEQRH